MPDLPRVLAPVPAPDVDVDACRPALALCASTALVEKGRAHGFDVIHFGAPARAFALRFDGRVVAYLNRCLHVPVEMDWNVDQFLDRDKTFILCATHGASYEPLTGRCAGGPCGRGRLTAIDTMERAGQVYWYPSHDTKPALAQTDGVAVNPAAGSSPTSESAPEMKPS